MKMAPAMGFEYQHNVNISEHRWECPTVLSNLNIQNERISFGRTAYTID